MTKLKNRFAELVAEKERRTGRKWTYEDISAATGLAMSTLSAYARNTVQRFDAVTIIALVKFFDCAVGDLFILENSDEGQRVAVPA